MYLIKKYNNKLASVLLSVMSQFTDSYISTDSLDKHHWEFRCTSAVHVGYPYSKLIDAAMFKMCKCMIAL